MPRSSLLPKAILFAAVRGTEKLRYCFSFSRPPVASTLTLRVWEREESEDQPHRKSQFLVIDGPMTRNTFPFAARIPVRRGRTLQDQKSGDVFALHASDISMLETNVLVWTACRRIGETSTAGQPLICLSINPNNTLSGKNMTPVAVGLIGLPTTFAAHLVGQSLLG